MRFVGPIAKRLQGPGADGLINLARVLLGKTRNQMKLGGLKQGWGKLRLPDGSWLRCYSNQNGAAPIDTVWIETAESTNKKIENKTLRMESGLLTWFALLENPLRVYVGNDLKAYFLSEGTFFPGVDIGVFLQGKAQLSRDLEASGRAPWYLAFSTTPPTLIGNYYVSEREWSENIQLSGFPSMFTGMMRLAMQAKLGAGKPFQELIPSAWGAANGKVHGIIKDPGGNFWVAEATWNTMRARPLIVVAELAQLHGSLSTLSGTDYDLALAWLFASALVDEEAEDIVCWTAAVPLVGSPYAHGWHYSQAGNAAAVVLVDSDGFQAMGRLYRLNVSWAGESSAYIPSAILAIGTSGRYSIHPTLTSFWVPGTNEYWLAAHSVYGPRANQGSSGPVYAFFNANDHLEVLSYTTVTYDARSEYIGQVGSGYCGTGTSVYALSVGSVKRSYSEGGFGIAGAQVSLVNSYEGDSRIEVTMTAVSGGGGGGGRALIANYPQIYQVEVPGGGLEPQSCTWASPYANEPDVWNYQNQPFGALWAGMPRNYAYAYDYTYTTATAEKRVTNQTHRSANGARQSCFIPPYDAESVIVSVHDVDIVRSEPTSVQQYGGFLTSLTATAIMKGNAGPLETSLNTLTFPAGWGVDVRGTYGGGRFPLDPSTCSGMGAYAWNWRWVWNTNMAGTVVGTEQQPDSHISRSIATFVGRSGAVSLPAESNDWEYASSQSWEDETRDFAWAQVIQSWGGGYMVRSGTHQKTTDGGGFDYREPEYSRFIGGA